MDSNYAHQIYSALNGNGNGFALTGDVDDLVIDAIAASGLTVVKDHGDGLIECRDGSATVLVGGDEYRRASWAVVVPARLLTPATGEVYAAAADLYEEVA